MTFEEWWETMDKYFSDFSIPDETKWFSEKAWNKAVNLMIEQEKKSQTVDKSEINYKGYFECIPILIKYIKMRAHEEGDSLAFACLDTWDRERSKFEQGDK